MEAEVPGRQTYQGLTIRFLILILMMIPVMAWGQDTATTAVANPDSQLVAADSRWGPVPTRSDSNSVLYQQRRRPAWETAAMVPYRILGIPLTILDFIAYQGLKGADNLGLFGTPPAPHPGLRLPLDLYLLPDFGISGLEGITYGLNLSQYDFLGKGNGLFLTASYSTRKALKLGGGTLFHLTPRTSLQLGGGYSDLPLTRYYGLGPTSEKDNRSYYNRKSWWGGIEGDHDLGGKLNLEFRGFLSRVQALDSRFEVQESLSTVHEGNLPPGYPGSSRGWTFRLGLVRNTTLETGRPQHGGFQKVSVSYFGANDGSGLKFLTYTADVQHFFPLWHTKRALGLRAFFNRNDNVSGAAIPFTRMVTFSRPDELRGFSSLRFYGLGSLGFSAEYRWPVWVARGRTGPGLDAYIFSDMGQVYMEAREIGWENLEVTGGFGFRYVGGHQKFVGRFELGFSREETVVTLKFSQNFQYDSKGMFRGKDPTRRR